MTALVSYGAGIRGDALFWSVLLGIVPMNFVLSFITLRLFPADTEATGDYRGILYGANRKDDLPLASEPVDNEPAKPTSTSDPPDHMTDAASFEGREEPRTFEGIALRAAAIGLLLVAVYMAAQPFVTRVFPEWGATKTGPPSFPLTVHIGLKGVRFTNGSTERWTCKAGLGVWPRYSPPFDVEAARTVEVPYIEFQQAGNGADSLQAAARDEITVECTEPSGLTHSWYFR
jgi:hypothetical protein